jgi:hypothetical protein
VKNFHPVRKASLLRKKLRFNVHFLHVSRVKSATYLSDLSILYSLKK